MQIYILCILKTWLENKTKRQISLTQLYLIQVFNYDIAVCK